MIRDIGNAVVKGHIKITDRNTGEVLVDKPNAVNYESLSVALANTLADQGQGYIYTMAFGNGGSAVDPTGVITYLPPNVTGLNASLYNETYAKVVDQNSASNLDPANNKMTVLHTAGKTYNSTNYNGEYVFDELGLKVWMGSASNLMLTTHVIFHPVQKSLNRQIQIDYTLRISTLTNLSAAA